MTERQTASSEANGEFDRGFAGQRRRQARLGLALSPAERLRWLEQTMAELRPLQGRAQHGRSISPTPMGSRS
ncbi:MAG: hypothetical protein WC713_05415 [Candidatus Methylomirabilota bacterium]